MTDLVAHLRTPAQAPGTTGTGEPPTSSTPPSSTANLRRPPTDEITAQEWRHMPLEDRQAVWDDYLRSQSTVPAGGSTVPPASTNPDLAAFLAQHDDLVTNQDFIEYFWNDKGGTGRKGWDGLAAACAELGIKPEEVTNFRSAGIRDLAYPPPVPDGSLPMTPEEARRFHIVQFTDPTYNPTGPASSVNCGPASLAMALDTQGVLPQGLTPEQKVDYARALMYGTHNQEVVVQGQTVQLLDKDHDTTGSPSIVAGATAAGLTAQEQTGWSELNTALVDGKPVVAFGDCYQGWKDQFADAEGRYGGGEIAHFISILGRSADGQYIVNDPMFTGGPVEMTRDELAVFFNKDGDNTPGFISMDPVQ